MLEGIQNIETRRLYAQVLSLSYRSHMTRAQISTRLGLSIDVIDQVLQYDQTHQGELVLSV